MKTPIATVFPQLPITEAHIDGCLVFFCIETAPTDVTISCHFCCKTEKDNLIQRIFYQKDHTAGALCAL